ncbi:MAG: polysaccharide deacetylase family protein [Planctomycetes bacterium]|nr:polysaccharide deacetylase family protein [Planctomycetota bacterium]
MSIISGLISGMPQMGSWRDGVANVDGDQRVRMGNSRMSGPPLVSSRTGDMSMLVKPRVGWRAAAVIAVLLAGTSGCAIWPFGLLPLAPDDDSSTPEPTLYVNLQIDAEQEDVAGLMKIADELKLRGISATVFVTADYANREALLVNSLYRDGFEIALHGYYTGEQLATMTLEEQRDLLTRAKQALEGCQPCGTYKPITGFRPQYFSQNEDTYRVLDELGITYNCGFKAGQIFIEGHEEDTTPYPVEGYGFHAVPITTVEFDGEGLYLCDIACALVTELTAEQWSQALELAIGQAAENADPLIVLFHGWYTGDNSQYEYWQPFVDFLDALEDRATFLTTQELVDFQEE